MARPLTLNQIARRRRDGTTLTRGEAVTIGLQLGLSVEDACTSAGIDRATYYQWKKLGALAHAKSARGEKLTKSERTYSEFVDSVERALIEFEEVCLGVIHSAGDGGRKFTETRTVRRTTAKGEQIIDTTTIEKVVMPQWQAKAWLLERRRPEKYRRRVELTGADGRDLIPTAQRAHDLADSFEQMLEAEAQAAEDERRRSPAPAFDGS